MFARHAVTALVLALVPAMTAPLTAQPADDSPRMTPVVKVIQSIEPAVVGLFVLNTEKRIGTSGSGSIIHPDGYVLTNDHVLPLDEGFAVVAGRAIRFSVVGRLPEKDIAVLKLATPGPLPTVPLGHSFDVMNGETVVVAGNPGGRGVVFTTGIVSSKRVLIDAANALAMTQFNNDRRDGFIQFDAAANRGNSGGPLVNLEGRLVGIVSALVPQEQNVGFAIPVDRVRELLDRVLDPETVHQRETGVGLNPQADRAVVTSVVPESAAARAGLRSGDELLRLDGQPIRHAADWTLALHQRLPSGQPLELVVKRGDEEILVKFAADPNPPWTGVDDEATESGLAYAVYRGKFDHLPKFSDLEPDDQGVVASVDLDAIPGEHSESYALTLEGLVRIDASGLYRLTIISDDGSRIAFHHQPFIDHDGHHPPSPASRLLRASAGWHPIRIEYFQGTGRQALELKLERLDATSKEMIEPAFVHRVEPEPSTASTLETP